MTERQWKELHTLANTEVTMLGQFVHRDPSFVQQDLTGILLNHLAYHTEVSLELKSLKWYV